MPVTNSRTAVYSALVLRSRPSKSNTEVFLLTCEEGIINATVYGGAKSKLRSHSAPYNSGQVWIYRDPAKDYSKLSDFDVRFWRPGLRELYERTMAAGSVAETILASHGGGSDWETALELATGTLDALENANEELCARLSVHFLWRWAEFLGIQPDLEYCAACENAAHAACKNSGGEKILWFNTRENCIWCADCFHETRIRETSLNNQVLLQLNPGSRRWLAAVGRLEPSLLYRYSMDNKSFHEAKSLAAAVMTAALGKRLASWDW